jgi:hypothetical protein
MGRVCTVRVCTLGLLANEFSLERVSRTVAFLVCHGPMSASSLHLLMGERFSPRAYGSRLMRAWMSAINHVSSRSGQAGPHAEEP